MSRAHCRGSTASTALYSALQPLQPLQLYSLYTLQRSTPSLGAVNWAHANRLAQGKPVCIRYDSMYAAHIATGLWKAKKHKPMAAAARQAWARLKRSREGQAWMAHVKGHTGNQWNERADRLAAQGRGGKSIKRYCDG